MKPDKQIYLKLLGFGLIFLTVMLTAACGAKSIRGESPMVRMNELYHHDNTITVKLSMRNINEESLDIQSIDFSLKVDETELFTYQGPADTNITANGTETWSVEIEESQSSRELLETLENGDVKSLPYSLSGSVNSMEDGDLHFEHEGHLYPLPGRPGHFR